MSFFNPHLGLRTMRASFVIVGDFDMKKLVSFITILGLATPAMSMYESPQQSQNLRASTVLPSSILAKAVEEETTLFGQGLDQMKFSDDDAMIITKKSDKKKKKKNKKKKKKLKNKGKNTSVPTATVGPKPSGPTDETTASQGANIPEGALVDQGNNTSPPVQPLELKPVMEHTVTTASEGTTTPEGALNSEAVAPPPAPPGN